MNDSFLSGYFGRPLHAFYHLFMSQIDALYQRYEIDIPVVCSSTAHLLHLRGEMSPADIGRTLGDPHQVVAQRLDSLIRKGLVVKTPDPSDKRRGLVALTQKGEDQAAALVRLMDISGPIYAQIEQEIDANLPAILTRAHERLANHPIADRIVDADPEFSRAQEPAQ